MSKPHQATQRVVTDIQQPLQERQRRRTRPDDRRAMPLIEHASYHANLPAFRSAADGDARMTDEQCPHEAAAIGINVGEIGRCIGCHRGEGHFQHQLLLRLLKTHHVRPVPFHQLEPPARHRAGFDDCGGEVDFAH